MPDTPLAGAACWRCGAPATLSFVLNAMHFWACENHVRWEQPVDVQDPAPPAPEEDPVHE